MKNIRVMTRSEICSNLNTSQNIREISKQIIEQSALRIVAIHIIKELKKIRIKE